MFKGKWVYLLWLSGFMVVVIFLVMIYWCIEMDVIYCVDGQQGNFEVKFNDVFNNYVVCFGVIVLLSVFLCLSKLFCRMNKCLFFVGRVYYWFYNVGIVNVSNCFVEKVFVIGKMISGSGQLQFFCCQVMDIFVIYC